MKNDLKQHVTDSLENSLSANYWDIVCTYLHKYHKREDVSDSDMLSKYVDGDWFDDDVDYKGMVNEYGDKLTANVHRKVLDTGLYIEALERFKNVYCKEIALVTSIILRHNFTIKSGDLDELLKFDKAYDIACAYVVRHQPSSETDQHFCVVAHTIYVEGTFEDVVIRFAKHCIVRS